MRTIAFTQGVFHSKWNLQIKRLAYDLCKAVPIPDEQVLLHVLPGIKVRHIPRVLSTAFTCGMLT
jgi:hypothetical protein